MERRNHPSPPSSRRMGAVVLAVGAAVGLFVLGWVLGRCPATDLAGEAARGGSAPVPAVPVGSLAGTSDPQTVELRLDAGSLRLLPDASLHLRPIEPLDLETPDR